MYMRNNKWRNGLPHAEVSFSQSETSPDPRGEGGVKILITTGGGGGGGWF